jgi:ribonuclease HI
MSQLYEAWFDGSSLYDKKESSIGGYVSLDGEIISTLSKPIDYTVCSSTLEYIALIEIMHHLNSLDIRQVIIRGDSKWVIEKVVGKRNKRVTLKDNPELLKLHVECLYLLNSFDYSSLIWIPREENTIAHELCSAYKEVTANAV